MLQPGDQIEAVSPKTNDWRSGTVVRVEGDEIVVQLVHNPRTIAYPNPDGPFEIEGWHETARLPRGHVHRPRRSLVEEVAEQSGYSLDLVQEWFDNMA